MSGDLKVDDRSPHWKLYTVVYSLKCVTCVHMSSSCMALGEDGVMEWTLLWRLGNWGLGIFKNLFEITKVINGRGLKMLNSVSLPHLLQNNIVTIKHWKKMSFMASCNTSLLYKKVQQNVNFVFFTQYIFLTDIL